LIIALAFPEQAGGAAVSHKGHVAAGHDTGERKPRPENSRRPTSALEFNDFSKPQGEERTNCPSFGLSKCPHKETPVPRYFFDTYDGNRLITDPEGMELPNLERVKVEAQNALPDLARDALPGGDQKTFIVSVRDDAGQVILRAALSLIVETAPENRSA
jgi:hypothetical protein